MVLVPRPWLSAHANTEAWLRNGEECRILLTASSPDGCTSGQKTCRNHKLDVDALRALWSAAFPEEELHGLISEQWKDMGWQGLMGTENMRGSMGLILLVVLIQNPSAAEDARLASLISLDRILKQIKVKQFFYIAAKARNDVESAPYYIADVGPVVESAPYYISSDVDTDVENKFSNSLLMSSQYSKVILLHRWFG
ncbi:hypothetical protein JHK87_043263 [Glycine soja]|nr:hypothetical protein JHK87_043263 [Glycine soja]